MNRRCEARELGLIDPTSQPLILPNLFGGKSQPSHLIIWLPQTLLGHQKLLVQALLLPGPLRAQV